MLGLTGTFGTILADPPWRFTNRTGKIAPEHRRLRRYETMGLDEICELPVQSHAAEQSHLYLWVPNALLPWGLRVMECWGFTYKTNLIWFKTRKDGGPDGGGLRTGAAGRRQVNLFAEGKREHSTKPEAAYNVIEACSSGPYLELFARRPRDGWRAWGDEVK